MATITVRSLGASYDPLQGNGKNCFLADLAAVAQIILTSLRLFQGEWWENLNAGTPVFQQMLGASGSARQQQIISLLLQQRILTCSNYVTGISKIAVAFDSKTRALAFTCAVTTSFGTVIVTNQPGANAAIG